MGMAFDVFFKRRGSTGGSTAGGVVGMAGGVFGVGLCSKTTCSPEVGLMIATGFRDLAPEVGAAVTVSEVGAAALETVLDSGITRSPEAGLMMATGPRDLPFIAGRSTLAPDRGSTMGMGSRLRPVAAGTLGLAERSTLLPVLGSTTSRIFRTAGLASSMDGGEVLTWPDKGCGLVGSNFDGRVGGVVRDDGAPDVPIPMK
mmetsp:Transcript_20959/g.37453  ORF Transcript_20959/g.37453 Transcript_20959/m.37453 type:complete len:201 (+) Transcript_20959:859-1461(+)